MQRNAEPTTERHRETPPRRKRPPWWRAALLLLVGGAAIAATIELQKPPTYAGREIAPTMDFTGAPWLIRESRESEEDPEQLLDALRLTAGMIVVDFGAGNGFHSLRIAGRIGAAGRVLAVDIQPELLAELETRAAKAGIDNVQPVLGTSEDSGLPSARADLVLMVDVYHELPDPEPILAAVRRSLAVGGRLALVEYRAEDPDVPIKPEHKMSKAQIMREIPPNGFKLVEEYDGLPWQHLMIFGAD